MSSDEAISREDVLRVLTSKWSVSSDEIIHQLIKSIKKLPSVKPQPTTESEMIKEHPD